ncbi:hypothetical protein [Propionivibrio sp.]|uniref:hypothetical protein n=1 Tax=Propionivibrio sp. TaxID=2212460 RepID=UPI003BF2E518
MLYAWRELYKALATRNIIAPMPSSERHWVKIRDWVEQQLTAPEQKIKSCYLLIDEADTLMGRELAMKSGVVGFVRSLQQMVENVQTKIVIRYVIAGLHNLTRMTTESNSALGKAETIALEPFNSGDDILRGIQLVTTPLAALGFLFNQANADLPLRILSVCSFYPAFIQLYCKKLLDHMYNKRRTDQAVAYVESIDLDVVEQDHDLLSDLQKKFEYTLDLDKRYKAIALILANVYYNEIEVGKHDGLTIGQIREYCEIAAEDHFRGMSAGAYEGLADEMRKLNVLDRNGSRYILRNPSIAMLIGDRARIDEQLKVLARERPEENRNHGDRRHVMEVNGSRLLFPLPIAWTHSRMDVIDGGLVILAGNNLSGLVDMCNSSGDWPLTQNDKYKAMSMSPTSAGAVIEKQRRNVSGQGSKRNGNKFLLASTPGSWRVTDIDNFSGLAVKAAAQNTRLVLIALPDRMFDIAQGIKSGLLSKDRKSQWDVVPVPSWSLDAVHFHLRENIAIAENSDACGAIIEATCGFGAQIQTICSGNMSINQAMGSPEVAKTVLAPDLKTFYEKIGWPRAISDELRENMELFMAHADGEERNGVKVDEYLAFFSLVDADLQFLNWMGLIQEVDNNTWHVPDLYARLISK